MFFFKFKAYFVLLSFVFLSYNASGFLACECCACRIPYDGTALHCIRPTTASSQRTASSGLSLCRIRHTHVNRVEVYRWFFCVWPLGELYTSLGEKNEIATPDEQSDGKKNGTPTIWGEGAQLATPCACHKDDRSDSVEYWLDGIANKWSGSDGRRPSICLVWSTIDRGDPWSMSPSPWSIPYSMVSMRNETPNKPTRSCIRYQVQFEPLDVCFGCMATYCSTSSSCSSSIQCHLQ